MSNNDKSSAVITAQEKAKVPDSKQSVSSTPAKKKIAQKTAKPAAKKMDPRNIIYSSMELTSSGDSEAKIIKLNLIVPSTKPNSVDFKRKIILCNNDGVAISDKAKNYHGITEDMLKNAPLAKDVSLPRYGYIAVWDGYVTDILFHSNNVSIRKGSLIDLHKLLRYTKEHASHLITLKKAAIEATKDSLTPEQVESFLSSPENKVLLLPVIFEYLRGLYKSLHGITDLASLARLSRQRDKKCYLKALGRIKSQIENRRKMEAKKRKHMDKRDNIKQYPMKVSKKVSKPVVEPIRAVA
jgi:hypothetical protein